MSKVATQLRAFVDRFFTPNERFSGIPASGAADVDDAEMARVVRQNLGVLTRQVGVDTLSSALLVEDALDLFAEYHRLFGADNLADYVTLADGGQLDAFNRLRVSEPTSIMSYSNLYDEGPRFWEDALTGTGTATYLSNEAAVRLRVAANGDKVVRQSRHYHPYQPGKSQLVKMTFVTGAAQTNVVKDVGYGDDDNGIFFRQAGDGTLSIVRRTNVTGTPVETVVNQADWNVDGFKHANNTKNPSRRSLDITKSQILIIDLQWLGVGRVRVGWEIDGQFFLAHQFLNANNLDKVYMSTASLPMRFEIEATGVPGATTDFIAICSAVDSEGGLDFARGIPFCVSNGVSTRTVSARTALLSMRPKATFNGITNRALIIPEHFHVYTDGGGLYELIYNGSIGGTPSWTSANADSVVEYDVAGTTLSGGICMTSGYITSGGGSRENSVADDIATVLPVVLDIAGANPINISVVYTPFTGSDTTAATLAWHEVR